MAGERTIIIISEFYAEASNWHNSPLINSCNFPLYIIPDITIDIASVIGILKVKINKQIPFIEMPHSIIFSK